MEEKTVTPKFLTREMAEAAYNAALSVLYGDANKLSSVAPQRRQLHVVVIVPGMNEASELLEPMCLFQQSFGDPDEFEYPFVGIAQSKAVQLWQGRNEDGHTGIFPHLLFSSEAPFWGGVKREGLVVTCSGIQPHLDKLMAGMIADMLIASAYEAWLNSKDAEDDVCFLT